MKLHTLGIACTLAVTCHAQRDSSLTTGADSLAPIVPFFSFAADEGENGLDDQDVVGLLQASRDVFVQFAAFNFGTAGYRIRGYAPRNQEILINGVNVTNTETGLAPWSSWGGLNDVTRFTDVRNGLGASDYSFAGPNGFVNIDSRASSFKKNTRLTATAGNRSYHGRVMVTHASGMNRRGNAFAFSASTRRGEQTNVKGTYFHASSFYASFDRRVSHRHLLSLTAFVAPSERGRATAAVSEIHSLTGDNNYNAAWGYQSGKIRNSQISRMLRPVMIVTHLAELARSKISTTLLLTAGKSGVTGISSFDSPNPNPDYYRNLPSYFLAAGDSSGATRAALVWEGSPPQIDWDRLASMNRANIFSADNSQVQNTTETRARYIVENRVERQRRAALSSTAVLKRRDATFTGGISLDLQQSRKFKLLEDLLGASFWLDVDEFAEGLGDVSSVMENDIDKPGRKVREGEVFGYDYAIGIASGNAWCQVYVKKRRLEWYAAAQASASGVRRTGFVANGKFPDNSRGKGAFHRFYGGGTKAGVLIKLNGRNYLSADAHLQNRMPLVSTIYLSPRVRHDAVPGITSETVAAIEGSYHLRAPSARLRVTGYHTLFMGQSWLRSYWDDRYGSMVNLFMKNVNRVHHGIEIGLEKSIQSTHVLQAATGLGSWRYVGRPVLTGWRDNTGDELFSERTAYLDNYRVGGSPQVAAGMGYKFNHRKFWFVGANICYVSRLYTETSPVRRTEEAVEKFTAEERDLAMAIVAQEKIPPAAFVKLIAGKSWRFRKKRMLAALVSVNNVLDNRHVRMTAYEQLRFDDAHPELFPPKYAYMPGFTVMLNTSLTF